MLTQADLFRAIYHSQKGCGAMPTTKVRGFMDEFPWVAQLFYGRPVSRVFVSKIEPQILQSTILCFPFDPFGALDPTYGYREILFLVDENGDPFCETKTVQTRRFKFFGKRTEKQKTVAAGRVGPNESVSDTLERLGERADRVRFIVSYFQSTEAIILYKCPKGVTVREWIRQQVEDEREGFRQEVASIDNALITN